MILFSSDLELILENKIIMNKLIIDVVSEKIFVTITTSDDIYNITIESEFRIPAKLPGPLFK